ncbi:hypothetical protein FBEOM_9402 [Fusarium beomiforme]|uniref:Uncharacterized protein n=1 Tax=Fusarium beomiforme TaxID=44412 RepID=A0A9P5DVX3_9HYPO|nr:hypothetical protein FBEOM_9402 [Fusarium beomiforme]
MPKTAIPDTAKVDRLTPLPNEILIQIALNVPFRNDLQLVMSTTGCSLKSFYRDTRGSDIWSERPFHRILYALRVVSGKPDKPDADWLLSDTEADVGDFSGLLKACKTTRSVADLALARTQTFGIVNVPASVAAFDQPGTTSLFRKRHKVAVLVLQLKHGYQFIENPISHSEHLFGGRPDRRTDPLSVAKHLCEKLCATHGAAGPTKELSFIATGAVDELSYTYKQLLRPNLESCHVLDMEDVFLSTVKRLAYMQKESVPIQIPMQGIRGDCEVVALSVGIITEHAVVVFRLSKPDFTHSKEVLVCRPFHPKFKFEWLSCREWNSSVWGKLLGY